MAAGVDQCPHCGADAEQEWDFCPWCSTTLAEPLYDEVEDVFDNGPNEPKQTGGAVSSSGRRYWEGDDQEWIVYADRLLAHSRAEPAYRSFEPDGAYDTGPKDAGYWARVLEHADTMVETAGEEVFRRHNLAMQFRAQVPELGPAGDTTAPSVRGRFLRYQQAESDADEAQRALDAVISHRARLQAQADADFSFWSLAGPGPARNHGDDDSLAASERRAQAAQRSQRRDPGGHGFQR